MIEAKGPGFAKLLRYSYFADRVLPARWTKQAGRQIGASGGRGLDWFFAEESGGDGSADFPETATLARINVLTVPAIMK